MRAANSTKQTTPLSLPVDGDTWERITKELELSPQQTEIVRLIHCGLKDKEIAAAMGLRFSTIRTYLQRIFNHLGVSDRTELVLHVFALYYRQQRDLPVKSCPQDC